MRKYRNDSLINEHKSMNMKKLAIYTIIQLPYTKCWHRSTSYKGGKGVRLAVEQLVAIRRCSLTSDDSRTGVPRTKTVQSTTQRLQRLQSFRTSPQEGLHNRTTSPTLSCSCFVADSHDHLEFLQAWLSAAGTITFKLFDAPLHESSAANNHYLRLCTPKITSI